MAVTSTPLAPALGLEITGLSGGAFVNQGVADDCLRRLAERGILVYRDARLDDETLVAFSRLLGDVVVAPMGGEEAHPEVSAITLDPAKSTLAEYRQGTFMWHIDGAGDELPQKATLLCALEVAEEGGDTEFASTYAAYDALPEERKAALEGVHVVHSFAASQRRAYPNASEKQRKVWTRVQPREHPLVWTRRDGRKSLLVGATTDYVVDRPPDEGAALLDELLEWCTQPRFVLRHSWRRGDLVVWDNTGVLHRALPYDATSRRLLHRTTLTGEEAVA